MEKSEERDPFARSVTLVDERIGSDVHFVGIRLLDNGDLLLEGQDINATAERFFGEREYEYQRKVEAKYLPAMLLWLLQERFASDTEFHAWLAQHNVPNQFTTW